MSNLGSKATHSLWINFGVKEVIVEVPPCRVHHGNPRPKWHSVRSNAHVFITFSFERLEKNEINKLSWYSL